MQEYKESNGVIEGLDIAIIGMAGRFPGAENIETFWENLKKGVEGIKVFTEAELKKAGIDEKILKNPNYVRSRGILGDADRFDAQLFDFSPREAEIIDPQHRVFMEIAWEALERAGYDPDKYEGLIGLFAGVGMNTYLLNYISSLSKGADPAELYQIGIANDKDFLTTRISYKLNLRGPSMDVQTACSTSLVAVHLACQNLFNYECDMALAGGVTITVPEEQGYFYQEGMILSPDGHCRPFDAKARGTVPGNGAAVVVLKRLADAIEDGDTIYAVIKGSAVNNDGSNRVGYTAPSVEGQAEVITMAQAVAGVQPDTIDYIECHGTGTPLGDPIEIEALKQVFQEHTTRKQFCAIGSVKSNIGHLDAAAGVTGLIKTALAIYHGQIPPSINYDQPNPQIDFANSPFFVNTKLRNWPQTDHPRRAGVSSFGIGGTNAHVVLEEGPSVARGGDTRPWQIIALSAKNLSVLDRQNEQLAQFLKKHPNLSLGDVSYTLLLGRRELNVRQAIVVNSLDDAAQVLETRDPQRILQASYPKEAPVPNVVFMFSGQGAQYPGMGRELYDTEPYFQNIIDECSERLLPELGVDLRQLLFPSPQEEQDATEKLTQTYITQPALFVVEYALARLWMHWGVEPVSMIGHSIGEYVAACLAGVFSLEDALRLVALRGRLMQSMPPGAMLSVALAEEELRNLLPPELSIAAINSVETCVVSGNPQAVEEFAQTLQNQGVKTRLLHTSHAFHSPMMEPILQPFRKALQEIQLNEPQLPFISNVTGTWITADEATDPDYWAQHLRHTVRFADGVGELLNDKRSLFLEVGPGKTLNTFVRRHPSCTPNTIVLSSLRHPKEKVSDIAFLLNSLARLWLAGVRINWKNYFQHEKRRRIPLPTYPFDRQRFWLEARGSSLPDITTELLVQGKQKDLSRWFYQPVWKRLAAVFNDPSQQLSKNPQRWLIFTDGNGVTAQLIDYLKELKQEVVQIKQGENFAEIEEGIFILNPGQKSDYETLLQYLQRRDWNPNQIVHGWSLTSQEDLPSFPEINQTVIQNGFYSLLYLGSALATLKHLDPVRLTVLSDGIFNILGGETLSPEKSLLLGPAKVLPQEVRQVFCKVIDLTEAFPKSAGKQYFISHILSEILSKEMEPLVAFRRGHRWIPSYELVPVQASDSLPRYLREEGVYLLTGGFGRIGMTFARFLSENFKARLVLVGRSPFPKRDDWEKWINQHSPDDPIVQRIQELKEMERHGARILTFSANVNNESELQEIRKQVLQEFGQINGIFHVAGKVGESSFQTIQELNKDACEEQFEAKVYGVQKLYNVFHNDTLDFCMLQSSLSTVLGGLGFAAYSAANHFQDALVQYLADSQPSTAWIAVDWDGWLFETASDSHNAMGEELRELSLTPQEGIEVLKRILNISGIPQWIISTGDLQTRLDKWVLRKTEQDNTPVDTAPQAGSKYARPNLPTPYVAPRTELEKKIAQEWSKLLGIEGIGVHDNFFDLGGNSLSGTQLVSQLRQTFQVELPLRALFEDPTIAGVAKMIEEEQKGETQKDKLASLLEQVEKLSDEEAKKLLNNEGNGE